MANEESFLGTGWSFPPTFRRSEQTVELVSDVVDIEQSLRILLSTHVGERVMQPKYGCNLDRLVFEPLDTTLQTYIADLIRRAILYFEPRIILDGVDLVPVVEEGRLEIVLHYIVATTNTRYNYVYPFYLKEGTGLQ